MAENQPETLVDAIQRDHREVEKLLEAVESSSGTKREQAFAELSAKLKAHEAAEQQVVHPLLTEEGNPEEAKELEAEESAASDALQKLDGLGVDSPEFERGFAQLKTDVLAHAQEEEREEHPALIRDTPADELERRGQMFDDAERDAAEE